MLSAAITIILVVTSCNAGLVDNFWSWLNGDENTSVSWPPKFCNDNDCPFYEVIKSNDIYEVRNYSRSTKWVSTNATGFSLDEVKRSMFMRLFRYIAGKNTRAQKIAMTVPVTTLVSPGKDDESVFTMSFFISDKITNPPTPKNRLVFINNMPPTTMYVRSFSGFANLADYSDQAKTLARALGYKNKPLVYKSAGYDAPYKLWNRHNEIWIKAEN